MTNEDVASELDNERFAPLRLHLVSGKTIDIPDASMAWMLRNAVMVVRPSSDEGYDIVALRNIERLERHPR